MADHFQVGTATRPHRPNLTPPPAGQLIAEKAPPSLLPPPQPLLKAAVAPSGGMLPPRMGEGPWGAEMRSSLPQSAQRGEAPSRRRATGARCCIGEATGSSRGNRRPGICVVNDWKDNSFSDSIFALIFEYN